MQFLQRSIYNKNSYCECERDGASHFRDPDDGSIRPISELSTFVANSRVERLSVPSSNDLPEPLPMPRLSFNEDEQTVPNVGDFLPLPKMNFDKKQDKENARNEDVLPLPSMQF